MHLDKLPTFFVKGDRRKPVFHTALARQLVEDGWTVEGEESPKEIDIPVVVEQQQEEAQEEEPSSDELEFMTKTQLIKYAEDNNIEIRPYASKSEIFELCKAGQDG